MPWTVSIVYLHQTEKLTMGYLFLSLALAAGYLEAAQLYPLNQGAALILSTLMAALFSRKSLL